VKARRWEEAWELVQLRQAAREGNVAALLRFITTDLPDPIMRALRGELALLKRERRGETKTGTAPT